MKAQPVLEGPDEFLKSIRSDKHVQIVEQFLKFFMKFCETKGYKANKDDNRRAPQVWRTIVML